MNEKTEKIAKTEKRIKLLAAILVIWAFALPVIALDGAWNGDEMITYSMANNQVGGVMFSRGKVGKYFEEYIKADTPGKMLENAIWTVKDVLANRRKATYFQMEPPSETGWYTKQEVNNWFCVEKGTHFDYLTVYKNACGDESHSFLYYDLVHTISSLLPYDLSGSKWSPCILNLLMVALWMFSAYRIAGLMGLSDEAALWLAFFSGSVTRCVQYISLQRDYTASGAVMLFQAYLYLGLLQNAKKKTGNSTKWLVSIAITDALGFWLSYHTTIFAIVIFIATIVAYLAGKVPGKEIRRFIFAHIICAMIALAAYPIAVFGMLSKLSNTVTPGEDSPLAIEIISILRTLIGAISSVRTVSVFVLLAVIAALIFGMLKKSIKGSDLSGWLFLAISSIVTCVITVLSMGRQYTTLPASVLVVAIGGVLIDTLYRGEYSKPLYAACKALIVALCVTNYAIGALSVKTQSRIYDEYSHIIKENGVDTALYIRNYKGNYMMTGYLREFEDTLVVTLPNTDLSTYSGDEKLLKTDELLVFVPNRAEDITKATNFLKKDLGFTSIEDLCKEDDLRNGEMILLKAGKG